MAIGGLDGCLLIENTLLFYSEILNATGLYA